MYIITSPRCIPEGHHEKIKVEEFVMKKEGIYLDNTQTSLDSNI